MGESEESTDHAAARSGAASRCSTGCRRELARCRPFAGLPPARCPRFPECCGWCRIDWCPSQRLRAARRERPPG